jgi:hypothetical protein
MPDGIDPAVDKMKLTRSTHPVDHVRCDPEAREELDAGHHAMLAFGEG